MLNLVKDIILIKKHRAINGVNHQVYFQAITDKFCFINIKT